ncbi:MAG: polyprenyl synthetase family protein [Anderseniella sp.]|jgi:geranylgeranyl diphosphate synthase type II|nr:polyprenyl synthetase family protein [Anderseniella sp.]
MDEIARIEQTLEAVIERATAADCPPLLAGAVRHAVFPGGARIRPRLCLAVAAACAEDIPDLTDAAASAIELLHCASLIHDDLPCFDDADIRRGKPSVHVAYGEPCAVLAGDAMIIMAFELLGRQIQTSLEPRRVAEIIRIIAGSVGMPRGITAGQAWELEPTTGLVDYQRAKTGSLFAASTEAGAAAAGFECSQWRQLGECLGEAYQVADDIRDVAGTVEEIGKPIGQDVTHGRPSAVAQLGMDGAKARLKRLVGEAMASIPDCPGRDELRIEIAHQSRRFIPRELMLAVA